MRHVSDITQWLCVMPSRTDELIAVDSRLLIGIWGTQIVNKGFVETWNASNCAFIWSMVLVYSSVYWLYSKSPWGGSESKSPSNFEVKYCFPWQHQVQIFVDTPLYIQHPLFDKGKWPEVRDFFNRIQLTNRSNLSQSLVMGIIFRHFTESTATEHDSSPWKTQQENSCFDLLTHGVKWISGWHSIIIYYILPLFMYNILGGTVSGQASLYFLMRRHFLVWVANSGQKSASEPLTHS